MASFGKRHLALLALMLCLLPASASANRAKARALTSEGINFSEAGRVELALSRFEEAMGSDPDYLTSYELAIPIWMRLGKLARAQTKLESLTLRCSECAFAWYALGALYRKSGRFDLAVLAYEIYLSKRPSEPDAYFGLAMALGATKDPRAPAVLRRYLSLETRSDRERYRSQARRLLDTLRSSAPKADIAGESKSAESKSGESKSGESNLVRIRSRAAEADKRGQWFAAAGYRALLWLWR